MAKFSKLLLFALTALLFISCEKLPETDFTWPQDSQYEAGDSIQFENLTTEAKEYAWEFGDGGTSILEHPAYIFKESGTYTVSLTATNDDGETAKTKDIRIYDPTQLGFVLMDTLLNIMEGVTVYLYDDQEKWDNFDDPLFMADTDSNGEVLFTALGPVTYYLWCFKEETGGLWFSGGYVDPLIKHKTVYYNVPIVWFPDEVKKSARESRTPLLLQKAL